MFNICIKRYSFEQNGFYIDENTLISSGMCFEDPKVKLFCPECGMNEFYGEPYFTNRMGKAVLKEMRKRNQGFL